ncbi:MAG: Coenzyme F420 hydrogenase/dehydrogenase, beta subunit C-terminal domain [Phocaeicola sp.]
MINITNKEECVGCNACTQICPKSCIAMREDHEGFLYPKVDESLCIDCSLCEKVCPVLVQSEPSAVEPLTYAAKNRDENIRRESSSGGLFTLLAQETIRQGGVVFGARFDQNWEVEHHHVESIEELSLFRGSKYLQSRVGNSFAEARESLKSGRQVLFSGTPCQIAGLKLFLRKDYPNLLTVDFVCHGVPSPKVWRLYLDEVTKGRSLELKYVTFRNKERGWKRYSFEASGVDLSFKQLGSENVYMRGFLRDLYLRPSCHACPAKSFKSGSDLTIADFWGIQNILPEFDDDKGASLVMISSERGREAYEDISTSQERVEVTYVSALAGNPSIVKSATPHPNRDKFYTKLDRSPISKLIIKQTTPTLQQKIMTKLYLTASKYGIINIIKKIR